MYRVNFSPKYKDFDQTGTYMYNLNFLQNLKHIYCQD